MGVNMKMVYDNKICENIPAIKAESSKDNETRNVFWKNKNALINLNFDMHTREMKWEQDCNIKGNINLQENKIIIGSRQSECSKSVACTDSIDFNKNRNILNFLYLYDANCEFDIANIIIGNNKVIINGKFICRFWSIN